ncbi:MAG: hypothetical protein KatS3mg089_0020 [Patescibacteria group bacterium]|nr:MAG: hypothetical protein KatS3mg089_0020 [Patescibacteria group bacterium]
MYKIIFSIILAFFLISANLAKAQIIPTTPTQERGKPVSIQNIKQQIQKEKEQMQSLIKQKREEFKTKLTLIRDTKKQATLIRIDEKISMINTRRTNSMNAHLTKLTTLLDKIASKAAMSKQQGYDTTSADKAIATAYEELQSAKASVSAQSEKEYVIQIQDETNLKNNVGQTIKTLTEDLRATYQTIIRARQSVIEAAREVAKLKNKSIINPATNAGAL